MDETAASSKDKNLALAWLVRALRSRDPSIFAASVVEAVEAGATKPEIDAVLAHAFAAASVYPPARRPFDPHEISEAFVQVLELR